MDDPARVPRRVFSIAEANHSLPRITKLVETLQRRYGWIDTHRQNPPFMLAEYRIVNEGPVDAGYVGALLAIRRTIRELERMGVQVKDVKSGLVDFPSRLDGREVLLCWRIGESKIEFWHDLQSGFANRQPLPPSAQEPETGGGEGN